MIPRETILAGYGVSKVFKPEEERRCVGTHGRKQKA